MIRIIKESDYPEFKCTFPVKIYNHSESDIMDRVQVKMSYKTALLYIDGENVLIFYPEKGDKPIWYAESIKDACEKYNVDISDEQALELAKYSIENVR